MSITAYSTTYFDDFNVKDVNKGNKTVSEKNYLRILFKPGYSVQVREINQLQSILQSQIDRLGSSIYKDGSATLGGNCTFDNNISVVDISTSVAPNLTGVTTISSAANGGGLTAKLLGYKFISTLNTLRLYVRYNNSVQGTDKLNISTFPVGNGSVIYADSSLTSIGGVTRTGYAAGAFLSEGIFYTKGSFVYTPAQAAFLDKAASDTLLNQLVIIGVTESVVNYSTDDTLKDNATGMPNYSAPGADRYTIDLSLAFLEMDPITDLPISTTISAANYIKLLTIENSQCLDSIKKLYTSLDDVLATRTYEESGNYTLSPFKITLREFYNDSKNGGRYTVGEMPTGSVRVDHKVDDGQTLYSLSLDPAVAYIKGYRVELTQARDLYSSKSRANPLTDAPVHSSALVGNYVVGKFSAVSCLPTLTNTTTQYEIHGETLSYYNSHNTSTLIGYCKIRAVDGPIDAIRLHLYDINICAGKYLSDAARIHLNQGSGQVFEFALNSPVTLLDAQHSTGLFLIPYGTTKAVRNLSYTYYNLFTSSVATNTFNVANSYFGDTSSVICVNASGVVKIISGTVTGNTGTSTITLSETVLSVILPIRVDEPSIASRQKTKTVTTITESLTPAASILTPSKKDIIGIISVTSGGKDVTSLCSISDDGQRDNYYTTPSINVGSLTGTLTITYKYFEHGSGDYFTVNSYPSDYLYDNIPSYKGVRLSDVYDFRPLLGNTYAPLDPDSVITSIIDYYLPKIDTVIVDSNGVFSVLPGESALEPKAAQVPPNAMALYTLNVPAYTYSPKDITVNYIDNRRFTMRDIGGIEQRISNIEYYTSLSLLETSAQNASIVDPNSTTGAQKLKNGYIVDAFTGHSIGDPTNTGYACAMDTTSGLLRPMYSMKNVRLVAAADNASTVAFHAHTITLPYTEQILINQSYASDTLSVNPYDVAVFSGNISLIPSSDNWKDTLHAPDLVVNDTGAYDAVALTADTSNIFGYQWNEWQTNWTGITNKSSTFNKKVKHGSRLQTITTEVGISNRIGTNTTLGYTDQTQSLGNRTIDISYIPYIRPIKIYFSATKLKPKTRIYAFFDGINVTSYCNQLTNIPSSINAAGDTAVYYNYTPTGNNPPLLSLPIITDEFGNAQGEFYIPNNANIKFKCGQRIFRLTDSPSNTASEETTIADIQYIASGTTETQQDTILSIRKPELVISNVSQSQLASRVANITYTDPLAQTFLIPNVEEGLFATGFDLFFSAKSSTLPVTAYIVICSNGIPTQQIMPFSSVTLQSSDVKIDATYGAVATTFKFSDPVYLLNGTEYAIVVTSNSADYRIWIATVGGTDVVSNTRIAKNVYNGVLLMSQNASTWTPEQTKDMKFVMRYAEFNTDNATVKFTQHLSGGITNIVASSITDLYNSAPTVTITSPGVGATGTATIASGVISSITVSGGSGYILPPLVTITSSTGSHAKAHAVLAGGTVSSIVIDNGGTGYGDATVKIDPPGVTATALANLNPNTNKISSITIVNPGSGYTTKPTVTISGVNTNSNPITTAIATVESADVSLFNLNRNAVAVNKTMISDSINIGTGDTATSYSSIIPNENYAVKAKLNISNTINRIELTTTLSSDSIYLSPVIDIERNSLICVNNIINDGSGTDTEKTMNAGNTSARYITRPIVLNNASDQVDIYINVNRPITNSNIRVYVKYNTDTTWNLYQPNIQVPVSSDPTAFTEIHYTDVSNKVLFTSFTVKIVMLSDTSTQVPTIKDFRAIATF